MNFQTQTSLLPLMVAITLILLATSMKAQNTNVVLQGKEAASVTDGVDVFSGQLEQVVPLITSKGRGELSQSLYLPLRNSPWRVSELFTTTWGDKAYHYYKAEQSNIYNNNFARAGYSTLGQLQVETKFSGWYMWETPSVTELRFTSNSGAIVHFRDVLTNGQSYEARARGCVLIMGYHPNPEPACTRGRVFRSIDGSNATFVADADVYDEINTDIFGGPSFFQSQPNISGTLYLSNGTRMRIESEFNNVTRITDRNGNYMKLDYVTEPVFTRGFLKKITDSLNREITIVYGDATQPSYYDEIVYKGFGGAERRIRINYTKIENAMLPGQSLGVGLFPGVRNRCNYLSSGEPCDMGAEGGPGAHLATSITIPSSIVLPNGKQYEFYYNNYLELARIKYPTGFYTDYVYGGVIGAADDGYTTPPYGAGGGEIYRRITSLSHSDETGQLVSQKTFSNIPQWVAQSHPSFPILDNVKIDVKDNGGTVVSSSRHYYYDTVQAQTMYTFLPMNFGKEFKTEILDPVSQTVLRRTETTWTQRVAFPWCGTGGWTVYLCSGDPNSGPSVDPRVTEVKTTLETGQVTKKTLGYDEYNNLTDVSEFDYGAGVAGTLLRRAQTAYLTAGSYTGTETHLLNLPTQVSVYDSNNVERARTVMEYDNYSSDAPLMNRSTISGFDTAFNTSYTTRGNLTASTQSLLTNGTVTGSITTHAQYDIAGNVIKVIDANGFAKTLDFSDHFGGPEGSVHSNSSPIELVGQTTYAFASSATNSVGTTYTKFDYYTARPVISEDANGIVSSAYSDNEPLDRLTKTIEAVNTPAQNQTTVSYDDTGRTITTSSDLNTNTDGALISKEFFDSFGRSIETRHYEGGSHYIVTKQQYDPLGRVYRTSSPYRPWQSESAIWTQAAFDGLDRMVSVTSPDQTVVTTSYNGNQVLVTDQAGKQRMSRTNALGQVKDIWEITASDLETEGLSFPGHTEVTAGYHTTYAYDALDNITTVTQGTQSPRTFVYDSLKRLRTATNPESGTTAYQYDAVGNLLVTTDARGISTHISYDAENRPTRRWYNSSSLLSSTNHNNPVLPTEVGVSNEAKFFYDSQTLPAGAPVYSRGLATGRLVAVTYGGGSAGDYFGFNAAGQVSLKIQQTGGINYQIQLGYNLGGAVSSETYPSGHSVTYNYDQAGRLADKDSQNVAFTGNLGDGIARTYSSGILYSPLGGMTKEQFGTDTPIYNKRFYNSRGQLAEIRESTSYTGTGDTTWNRGAIINFYSGCWGMCGGSNSSSAMAGNNGTLKRQEVYIPLTDQLENGPSTSWSQQYDYDALNRLHHVNEDAGSTSLDWKQEYVYDRYGNRRIGTTANQTSGSGINIRDFAVETATNRLYAPGDLSLTEASRQMQYDPAGNLKKDIYGGAAVARAYDAENRMTSETQASSYIAGSYTYDATGQRVRRTVNGVETWQVYGVGGELLGEYAANAAAMTPQEEYGYRSGQLLVTAGTGATTAPAPSSLAAAPSSGGVNVVLNWSAASGATNYRVERKGAAGSFTLAGTTASTGLTDTGVSAGSAYLFRVCAANAQGNCTSVFSNIALGAAVGFPTDPTITSIADDPTGVNVTKVKAAHITELRIAVNAVRTLAGLPAAQWTNQTLTATVTVISADDVRDLRLKLNDALTALGIQTSNYDDQTLAGAPNGTIIKKIHITQLRLRATSGTGGAGGSSSTQFGVQWLVADQLGTPRMIFDQTGSLATTKRHDYLPFGEELFATQGMRTAALGYSADAVRQKFTQYERDSETNLDYAQARYYGNIQGRFTSPDPFRGSMAILNPQSINRYTYVQNNPLIHTDPSGFNIMDSGFLDFWGDAIELLPGFGTNWGSYTAHTEQQYQTGMQQTINAALARDAGSKANSDSAGGSAHIFYAYGIWFWGYFDENGVLTWWTGQHYSLPGEYVETGTGPRMTPGYSAEDKDSPSSLGLNTFGTYQPQPNDHGPYGGQYPPGRIPWNTPYGPNVANAYRDATGGPFDNNLNNVSRKFPNDPWSNCVRGCLLTAWDRSEKKYYPDFYTAHTLCYGICTGSLIEGER